MGFARLPDPRGGHPRGRWPARVWQSLMSSDQGPAGSFAHVNGQRIHYVTFSADGAPLVFVHGLTSDWTTWELLAPRFTDRYRVLAIDLRGHGDSSKPERGYHWQHDYGMDLAAFVREVIGSPAVLVGHSLGGAVVSAAAACEPQLVRAVVLEDPAIIRRTREQLRERILPDLELKRLSADQRVDAIMAQEGLDRQLARRRSRLLGRTGEAVLTELMEGRSFYPFKEIYGAVHCPALIVYGDLRRGGIVADRERRLLAELMPHAVALAWDDVGHRIHGDQRQRFAVTVRRFLDGLDGLDAEMVSL